MTDLREKIARLATEETAIGFAEDDARLHDMWREHVPVVLRAIEAAGFKVVDPENVTDEMLMAMANAPETSAMADTKREWARYKYLNKLRAALAAAPKVLPEPPKEEGE